MKRLFSCEWIESWGCVIALWIAAYLLLWWLP